MSVPVTTSPCLGTDARNASGRLHLPVAPRANTMSKFSSPACGKKAITPAEALQLLTRAQEKGLEFSIVGITGPGEPFAFPELTFETLELVREKYPEMTLCLTTNGINGAQYAEKCKALSLSHVSVTVNAVDPEVAMELYAWVRPGKKTLQSKDGCEFLIKEQAAAVSAFKDAGLPVKINTTVYPGVNDAHLDAISRTMALLGADAIQVDPYVPLGKCIWPGETPLEAPSDAIMEKAKAAAALHLPLSEASGTCSAQQPSAEVQSLLDEIQTTSGLPRPDEDRPNVALASTNGMEVNCHLGHAHRFMIYGPKNGLPSLLEMRDAPDPGDGDNRWEKLAEVLSDCKIVVVESAGPNPTKILKSKGITIFNTTGEVEAVIEHVYGLGKKGKSSK